MMNLNKHNGAYMALKTNLKLQGHSIEKWLQYELLAVHNNKVSLKFSHLHEVYNTNTILFPDLHVQVHIVEVDVEAGLYLSFQINIRHL